MQLDQSMRQALTREIPILTREIRALYQTLDRKYRLNGAKVPITFGYDTDTLGAYTQGRDYSEEEFHFSLLFVGRSLPHPLSKEDRIDLYKHEYAHYMQYNMPIPKEYTWQHGTHGSAWKYCCSLIGAAPTPLYRAGEGRQEHKYEKVLKNPIHDKSVPIRDRYRREMAYQKERDSKVHFTVGEKVHHPSYGPGEIAEIKKQPGSVRLHIEFEAGVKIIDQKWMLKTKYNRAGDK